jgi:hypothetical protein
MEEIKAPKKERKFLKAVGNIAKVLANELVMGIGRKFIGKAIDKVGNKTARAYQCVLHYGRNILWLL